MNVFTVVCIQHICQGYVGEPTVTYYQFLSKEWFLEIKLFLQNISNDGPSLGHYWLLREEEDL